MSTTPRTDAAAEHPHNLCLDNDRAERLGDKAAEFGLRPPCKEVVPADFARELEQENARLFALLLRSYRCHTGQLTDEEAKECGRQLAEWRASLNTTTP